MPGMPCLQPRICWNCQGSSIEPDADDFRCQRCDGGGFEIVSFDLLGTPTYPKGRPAVYNPGTRILSVTRKNKTERYRVTEFTADQGDDGSTGRAFQFEKISDGTRYNVWMSENIKTCDCPGSTYEASEKADSRGQGFFTLGCIHLDFLFWGIELMDVHNALDVPSVYWENLGKSVEQGGALCLS